MMKMVNPFPRFFYLPLCRGAFHGLHSFSHGHSFHRVEFVPKWLADKYILFFLNTQKTMEHDFVFKVDVCFKETVDLSWEYFQTCHGLTCGLTVFGLDIKNISFFRAN